MFTGSGVSGRSKKKGSSRGRPSEGSINSSENNLSETSSKNKRPFEARSQTYLAQSSREPPRWIQSDEDMGDIENFESIPEPITTKPLAPLDWDYLDVDISKLIVYVKSATQLIPFGSTAFQKVHCFVRVDLIEEDGIRPPGAPPKKKNVLASHRTPTDEAGGTDPEFGERSKDNTFEFDVGGEVLFISIFDEVEEAGDDSYLLGTVEYQVSPQIKTLRNLKKGQTVQMDRVLNMQPPAGPFGTERTGKIYLEMECRACPDGEKYKVRRHVAGKGLVTRGTFVKCAQEPAAAF